LSIRATNSAGQPNTLIEKLGFRDDDRKAPEHDQIVSWLDAQLRSEGFLRTLIPDNESIGTGLDKAAKNVIARHSYLKRRTAEETARYETATSYNRNSIDQNVAYFNEKLAELANKSAPGPPPDPPPPAATTITWELPLGDSRWIAGFLDIYATIKVSRRSMYTWNPSDTDWDAPYWGIWSEEFAFGFEVKAAIPSVGDLIRQIRFYEAKWNGHRRPAFYVVSPHGKHAPALVAQGIGFVHHPSAQVVPPGGS
jgi:hypothetical protein